MRRVPPHPQMGGGVMPQYSLPTSYGRSVHAPSAAGWATPGDAPPPRLPCGCRPLDLSTLSPCMSPAFSTFQLDPFPARVTRRCDSWFSAAVP